MSVMTTLLLLMTQSSSHGILPLLLIKILALKGLIFLGPPITLGSFIIGHGTGLLFGKVLGIEYLLDRWYGKRHHHQHHHHRKPGWKPSRPPLIHRLRWILKSIFHHGWHEGHPPMFSHPPEYYIKHYDFGHDHHHKYKHTSNPPPESFDDEHDYSTPVSFNIKHKHPPQFDDEHDHPPPPSYNPASFKHEHDKPTPTAMSSNDPSYGSSVEYKPDKYKQYSSSHFPKEFLNPPGSKPNGNSWQFGEGLDTKHKYSPPASLDINHNYPRPRPAAVSSSNPGYGPSVEYKANKHHQHSSDHFPSEIFQAPAARPQNDNYLQFGGQSDQYKNFDPAAYDEDQLYESSESHQYSTRNDASTSKGKRHFSNRQDPDEIHLDSKSNPSNQPLSKDFEKLAEQYIIEELLKPGNNIKDDKLLASILQRQFALELLESSTNKENTTLPLMPEFIPFPNDTTTAQSINNLTTSTSTSTTTTTTQKPIPIQTEKANTKERSLNKKKNTLWDMLSNFDPSEMVPDSVLKWMFEPSSSSTDETDEDDEEESLSTNRRKRETPKSEVDEEEAKIIELTNSFMKDVRSLFSIVSMVDINQCLEKMVCDVHSRANKEPVGLSSYESNLISAFKVMDGIMPYSTIKNEDSSRKYRKAARLGRRTKSSRSCQLAFPSCSMDSRSIISLGNIGFGENNKSPKE